MPSCRTCTASDLTGSEATCVYDSPVHGPQEVHDSDRVRVGDLAFTIRVEDETASPSRAAEPPADAEEEAAHLLLDGEETPASGNPRPESAETAHPTEATFAVAPS